MKKVGLIGWRGMVGSVLLQRMNEESDFQDIDIYFFSTSQKGLTAPSFSKKNTKLLDAYDIDTLKELDILISCQGSDYTIKIHTKLRSAGWDGFWIDAASHLRLDKESMIVLDPINKKSILNNINNGIKNYIGGNCTVSLMLIAIHGLLDRKLVDWVNVMSYQAISGAGAAAMQELLDQQRFVANNNDHSNILEKEAIIRHSFKDLDFPDSIIQQPLSLNLLPWIDSKMPSGQTREEWKSMVEANRILDNSTNSIIIDGTCVRVPSLRSHCQALTVKMNQEIPIDQVIEILASANKWIKYVENDRAHTLRELSPLAVSGTLNIAIGRVRKSLLGEEYINIFTAGDQLLWGAAEPLRRTLKIILQSS
jgi:aspartate-semialdehyde dehydrogenase